MNALIGYTGFVGSTLAKQNSFEALFRSTNIKDISGQDYELIVCAGAPGQKWLANKEPETDLASIETLMTALKQTKCRKFVLISTVDVYKDPNLVTEETQIDTENLHPYGKHRFLLEEFVKETFDDYLIVRLPGLVGPGLRKNAIYDFKHDNNIANIDHRHSFQFYPMVNLWSDIELAMKLGLKEVNLSAEPITIAEIAKEGFGQVFENVVAEHPVTYDMGSLHADKMTGSGLYHYSKKETLLAIRSYAQTDEV